MPSRSGDGSSNALLLAITGSRRGGVAIGSGRFAGKRLLGHGPSDWARLRLVDRLRRGIKGLRWREALMNVGIETQRTAGYRANSSGFTPRRIDPAPA